MENNLHQQLPTGRLAKAERIRRCSMKEWFNKLDLDMKIMIGLFALYGLIYIVVDIIDFIAWELLH